MTSWQASKADSFLFGTRRLGLKRPLSDCLFIVRVAESCSLVAWRGLEVVQVDWSGQGEDG